MSNASPRLSFELRRWSDLEGIVADWSALARGADIPNVFADPEFARPAADALGVADKLKAALFWREGSDDRTLVGFVPLITRRRWLVTPPNLEVWTHPFAPASLPLATPDAADALGAALVAGLAGSKGMPRILLLPKLQLDSAFAIALLGAGAPLFVHGGYQKPIAQSALDRTDLDGAGYLAHAIRSNRRNRMKRQAEELEQKGMPSFTLISEQDALKAACDRFMVLEAAGWKGRGGTDVRSDLRARGLFESVCAQMIAAGRLRVAELTLDDQTIGSLIILCAPGHFWFWKICFDEDHAAQSPGRMLLVRAIEAVLNEQPGALIDSCAAEAGHFSGNLLRERVAMGDVLLSTRPRPNIIFRAANLLEALRNRMRALKHRTAR